MERVVRTTDRIVKVVDIEAKDVDRTVKIVDRAAKKVDRIVKIVDRAAKDVDIVKIVDSPGRSWERRAKVTD